MWGWLIVPMQLVEEVLQQGQSTLFDVKRPSHCHYPR
jgi:hypothetical protein